MDTVLMAFDACMEANNACKDKVENADNYEQDYETCVKATERCANDLG